MSELTLYTAEFDIHPNIVGHVSLIERQGTMVLEVTCDGTASEIFDAYRDQWGVWLTVNGICIPQEDGTRSFLDGLIKALTEMRRLTECDTKEATVVST
jgi:hypothetical protein